MSRQRRQGPTSLKIVNMLTFRIYFRYESWCWSVAVSITGNRITGIEHSVFYSAQAACSLKSRLPLGHSALLFLFLTPCLKTSVITMSCCASLASQMNLDFCTWNMPFHAIAMARAQKPSQIHT